MKQIMTSKFYILDFMFLTQCQQIPLIWVPITTSLTKKITSIPITAGLHDLEYQNSTTTVAASWHGFVDYESYIYRYEWCVGTSNATDECDVMDWTSVGLQTTVSKTFESPLNNGWLKFQTCSYVVISLLTKPAL